MKEIKLSPSKHGEFIALVDDEDFEGLSKYTWYPIKFKTGHVYAARSIARRGMSTKVFLMHRQIMGLSNSKMFIDHKNHNTLDNQKSNLRECTRTQNAKNRSSQKNSTSKFLGVFYWPWENTKNGYTRRSKAWVAKICDKGKQKKLGRFLTESEAAMAYNEAAKIYHGEFANLNIL